MYLVEATWTSSSWEEEKIICPYQWDWSMNIHKSKSWLRMKGISTRVRKERTRDKQNPPVPPRPLIELLLCGLGCNLFFLLREMPAGLRTTHSLSFFDYSISLLILDFVLDLIMTLWLLGPLIQWDKGHPYSQWKRHQNRSLFFLLVGLVFSFRFDFDTITLLGFSFWWDNL